jgi:soluble lytic murein transglycosylase-like protein
MHPAAGVLAAGLILSVALARPAAAEDFTFRRIKAHSGKGPFITVQIDPAEQARRLAVIPPEPEIVTPAPAAAAEAAPPASAPTSSYAWFWEAVPTNLGAPPDRFERALAALGQGPDGKGVRAPRLQALQDIARAHGTDILRATVGTEVSPALALAVMAVESGGRPDAVSPAGAEGLMQLIPATAERFGVTDSLDAGQNIKGGVAYLHWLMEEFGRDPLMVLAAYNAGEGAVRDHAGVPPYAETRDYVPKVLAAWQVAQGLCLTPPQFVTDPCVFNVVSAAAD